jgi:hypothetical protein
VALPQALPEAPALARDSVYLIGVHLIGVHLTGMHLIGVYLMGMYFMGVYLMGVYLMGVYQGIQAVLLSRTYVFAAFRIVGLVSHFPFWR